MRMKRNSIIGVIFLCMIGLNSCSSKNTSEGNRLKENKTETEVEANQNGKEKTKQAPEMIKKTLSSGVKVDAKIEVNDTTDFSKAKEYSVDYQEFDVDKLYHLFMEKEEIVEKTEEKDTESDEGNGIIRYYKSKTGKVFGSYGGISINYSTSKYQNIQVEHSVALARSNGESELDELKQELPFETREQAEKKVTELLTELGVNFDKGHCYSIEYNWLKNKTKEIEAAFGEQGRSEKEIEEMGWSEKLNCYLFEYSELVDKVPVMGEERLIKNRTISSPTIRIIYSKDGIEEFEVSYLYKPISEMKVAAILDTESAVDKLDEKYNSIILEGEYTVSKMRLEYVVDYNVDKKQYSLIPAWHFDISHEIEIPSEEDTNKLVRDVILEQVYMNAIDGTEILMSAEGEGA